MAILNRWYAIGGNVPLPSSAKHWKALDPGSPETSAVAFYQKSCHHFTGHAKGNRATVAASWGSSSRRYIHGPQWVVPVLAMLELLNAGVMVDLPDLVNIQKTMQNHHFQWVNPRTKSPFSIAMLNIVKLPEGIHSRVYKPTYNRWGTTRHLETSTDDHILKLSLRKTSFTNFASHVKNDWWFQRCIYKSY